MRHSRVPSRATCLAILAITLFGCAVEAPPDPSVEIAQARSVFWEAHEKGDPDALANVLTDDAVLWAPGMNEVRGKEAIRAAAQQMFSSLRISDFTIEEQELQVYDSLAYEFATYTETLMPSEGEASRVRGRYVIVWKRSPDGEWRVRRNTFNMAAPPE